jgi:LysR family transcriptional regulator, transcriptional activator of the cysJI operon
VNFNQLLAFFAVARERSFTQAAKILEISQPAVTRRILEMEQAHNVKLLERTKRRVVLTEQGKLLLSYAERIVALADEAEVALKSMAGLKSGRIEIGTSRPVASAYLSSIAIAFKQRFPGVVPAIHVENSQWILEQVLGFRLDLGIIGMKPRHPDLIVIPFFNEQLVIVVPSNHAWARRKALRLEDLDGQSLIMREKGSGTRELIDSAFDKLHIKPVVAMEVGSNEAIKRAVEGNLGLAFFPPSVVDAEIKEGVLKALNISGVRLALSFNVIYHREKRSSPLIRAFIEVLREQRPKLVRSQS